MREVLALVLIVFQAKESVSIRTCCHPDHMMGKAFDVEERQESLFAVDFTTSRSYHKPTDTTQDRFTIVDFMAKRRYTGLDGTCSLKKDTRIAPFLQCLTDDMHLGTFTTGDSGPGNSIDLFKYTVGNQWVWKYMKIQGDKCVPLILHVQENGTSQTFIYSNIKPAIDFDVISASFNACKDIIGRWDGRINRAYEVK